ncbi:MAG: PilN domain-containing protein [Candidatus Saccharibacteria bacterium]
MSLQINLLPEARIVKLQAMARRRNVTTATVVVGIIFGTIAITLILLLGYTYSIHAANAARVNTLKENISKSADMEKQASTLQDNLAAFSTQNTNRLYVSQMFQNLGNAIPSNIKITSFEITGENQVTISGTAPSYVAVGVFSKALQEYNVNFLPQPNLERKALFTNVQITTVSKGSDSAGDAVNFTMTFNVDSSLFNKNGSSQ